MLSKRASPDSQLSADLSPGSNPPVSDFTHPTLALLNLSRKSIFNRCIGDVVLTMYSDFSGNVLVSCSQQRYCPLLVINLAPCSAVVTRYIELGRLTWSLVYAVKIEEGKKLPKSFRPFGVLHGFKTNVPRMSSLNSIVRTPCTPEITR